MYCRHCGFHNDDPAPVCEVCGRAAEPIASRDPEPDIRVDATRMPLGSLIRHSFRTSPVLVMALAMVFFIPYYWISRLIRRPIPVQHIFGSRLRYRKIEPGDEEPLLEHLEESGRFLVGLGFEEWMVFRVENLSHDMLTRRYIHREKHLFAGVRVQNSPRPITSLSFTAMLDGRTIVYLNSPGLSVKLPGDLDYNYLPGASPDALYEAFERRLAGMGQPPAPLTAEDSLIRSYDAENRTIQAGIEQRVFIPTPPAKRVRMRTCRRHPTRPAVRVCKSCGAGMCETCAHPLAGDHFCDRCIEEARASGKTSGQPLTPVPEDQPAGFGVRAAAAMIDLLFVSAPAAAVFLLLSALGDSSGAWCSGGVVLAVFLVLLAWGLYYVIVPLVRRGRTPGQRLFGLRVVDDRGDRPGAPAALIRAAYYLLCVVFIVPLLGFLFIPFTSGKRGIHDILAGTYVRQRKSRPRTLVAWGLVFLLVLVPLAVVLFEGWTFLAYFVLGGSNGAYVQEVQLEAEWSRDCGGDQSIPMWESLAGETVLVTCGESIEAVDLRSGRTLWQLDEVEARFPPFPDGVEYPVVIGFSGEDGADGRMTGFDLGTGRALWQQPTDMYLPMMVRDEKLILFMEGGKVQAVDPADGAELWEKDLGREAEVNASLMEGGIMMESWLGEVESWAWVERHTGKVIREGKTDSLAPMAPGRPGMFFFLDGEGRVVLMDLAQWRPVWRSEDKPGWIGPLDGKGERVYASDAALAPETGARVFSYPRGHRLVAPAGDFLILQAVPTDKTLYADGRVTFIDSRTGRELESISPEVSLRMKLAEDDRFVWLAGARRSEKPGGPEKTMVIAVDKSDRSLRLWPLGLNLPWYRMHMLPEIQSVYIPTLHSAGLFRLPGDGRLPEAPAD